MHTQQKISNFNTFLTEIAQFCAISSNFCRFQTIFWRTTHVKSTFLTSNLSKNDLEEVIFEEFDVKIAQFEVKFSILSWKESKSRIFCWWDISKIFDFWLKNKLNPRFWGIFTQKQPILRKNHSKTAIFTQKQCFFTEIANL